MCFYAKINYRRAERLATRCIYTYTALCNRAIMQEAVERTSCREPETLSAYWLERWSLINCLNYINERARAYENCTNAYELILTSLSSFPTVIYMRNNFSSAAMILLHWWDELFELMSMFRLLHGEYAFSNSSRMSNNYSSWKSIYSLQK